MDEFKSEEMKKSRPVVKSRLSKLHKWLDDHVPKPIKNAVDKAFLRLKNSILRLKFHDGHYQFKVPFMLFADFESILKPVDERYRDKMSTMMTERKGKAPYTEKINTHVPSGWCVHSTFASSDASHHLKMYQGKDCVEKFVEYIEEGVQQLYETFPR